jgi:hypothetical protein
LFAILLPSYLAIIYYTYSFGEKDMARQKPEHEKTVLKTHTFRVQLYTTFSSICKAGSIKMSAKLNELMEEWVTRQLGKNPEEVTSEATLKSNIKTWTRDADGIRRLLMDHKVYYEVIDYLQYDLKLDFEHFRNYKEVIAALLKDPAGFSENDVSLTISLIETRKALHEAQSKLNKLRAKKYGTGADTTVILPPDELAVEA